MRKITVVPILVFLGFYVSSILLGGATSWILLENVPLGDFRGVVVVIVAIIFMYAFLIFFYRLLFFRVFSLPVGDIRMGSKEEFIINIYLLFFFAGFDLFLKSLSVPVFLKVPIYRLLGAKVGNNSYSAGILFDPHLITMGNNSLCGHGSILVPHQMENEKLSHLPIIVGDNVTIGAYAVVFQGVTIGNNSIIAAGAVVSKNTVIGENEIWGGVPAKFIKKNVLSVEKDKE